ncbi:DNA primase [Neoehrlichia mikurensis]|uniref:DNA primase n=1 Tax=Neoehrlichia mikurensis TaxID=89586 RepID=A0A9Q9BYT9_9RICK|nr:DNA primase [Neoehrlichia mikurensis]QXK92052.1 DNA primase [Neoehrlichia mikurensis]QXK92509.1 DNA primase [Neoehrlichia mikurensis]QXK93745.1 DNA primase [Neoehrlichia mikurensis]UTO55284.1 DNA primase [Neoehrlichia mikurensis]UTO56204.1 DNA primase [Neoehrlichia mikurensis]
MGYAELIKSKAKLSDVVAKRIKLLKKGNVFIGLCPFHNEKTPSFTVNDDRSFYYCFGCGAHGDVIQFVCDLENMSFKQSLEYLAQIYNVDIIRNSSEDCFYIITRMACEWFISQLHNNKLAREYLEKRGISDNIIQKFKIGYTPSSGLKDHLLSNNATIESMQKAGLLNKGEREYFYERIMFPIFNYSGKIVAFGGRVINSKNNPKYLNSAENLFFKKRNILYGMHFAVTSARKQGCIIVVEGYMDVLAMHQLGIENVVGLLGTSMNKEHLDSMWAITSEIIVWMDGDDAGFSSLLKILHLALSVIKSGRNIKFITSQSGKDPCDICMNGSVDDIQFIINNAKLPSDFIWEYELSCLKINNQIKPEQCLILEGKINSYVAEISDTHIAKYYKSFFYQQIKKLQNSYTNSALKSTSSTIGGFMVHKFINTTPQSCVEEYNQMKAIYIIVQYPELLNDPIIFEQFARFKIDNNDFYKLQQHIINIQSIYFDKLSKNILIMELKNNNLYTILTVILNAIDNSGCMITNCKIHLVKQEWEKIILLQQLQDIQSEILKLMLEGKDEIAARLSNQAQIIDSKLKELWRY